MFLMDGLHEDLNRSRIAGTPLLHSSFFFLLHFPFFLLFHFDSLPLPPSPQPWKVLYIAALYPLFQLPLPPTYPATVFVTRTQHAPLLPPPLVHARYTHLSSSRGSVDNHHHFVPTTATAAILNTDPPSLLFQSFPSSPDPFLPSLFLHPPHMADP